jgi:outer membrane protein assembly factor BamB
MPMRRTLARAAGGLVASWLTLLVAPTTGLADTEATQARLHVLWRTPLVDPPSAAWKPREHGGVLLSPSGTVLFAPSAHGVAALDAASGRRLWQLNTSERVDARPVLRGAHLYVATSNGTVHALDARTGAPEWPKPTTLDASVQSPLAADARAVFVAADPGTVVALSRQDGQLAWTYKQPTQRDFLVSGQSGATVVDDLVVCGLPNGKLVALGARDGGLTWEIALDKPERSPYADVDTTPVVVPRPDGKPWVLAASHSGGLYALSASDGAVQWQYAVSGLGQPLLDGDRVLVLATDGELHALSAATGRPLWVRKLSGAVQGHLQMVPEAHLLVVPTESGLDLLDAGNGLLVHRRATETGFAAAPVVAGTWLWTVSNGGVAYAFAVRRADAWPIW